MSEKVQVEIQRDEDRDKSEKDAGIVSDVVEPDQESEASEQTLSEKEPEDTPSEDDPEAKLKAAEQKADEYYDRLLRTSAEFDNYKKRTTREMRDTVRYANEKLFKELLFVVDNLERAIESAQQESSDDDPVLQGVRLTLSEVEKILERHNVKPVTALGEPFDPNFHQAMMQQETEEHPANMVVNEMQKGYLLHDRLLRPAMVVVSKPKSSED